MYRRAPLFFILAVALMLAACGQSAAPESVLPSAAAATARVEPSTINEVCSEASGLLGTWFGAPVLAEPTERLDGASGTTLAGCHLQIDAMGDALPGDFMEIASQLRGTFGTVGWEEDGSRVADGPTGTATTLRRDGYGMDLSVSWQPGPAVSCMADQPLTACNVPLDQRQYSIVLDIIEPAK